VIIVLRSYWIPGPYAPLLSEKHNAFLRLLKNKGFKEERRTKNGMYAISKATTLESNKSLTGWSAFPLPSPRPETRRTIRGRRPYGTLSLSAVSQPTRTRRGTPPRRLRRRASEQRVAVAPAGPGIKVALPVCRQAVPGAAGMRVWAGKDGDREGDLRCHAIRAPGLLQSRRPAAGMTRTIWSVSSITR